VPCSHCDADLESDDAACPECGAVPVDETDESWVRLAELSSETEARLLQGYLETHGIPCSFESLAFRAEPVTFGPLARVRLYVLSRHLERARSLVERAELAAED